MCMGIILENSLELVSSFYEGFHQLVTKLFVLSSVLCQILEIKDALLDLLQFRLVGMYFVVDFGFEVVQF